MAHFLVSLNVTQCQRFNDYSVLPLHLDGNGEAQSKVCADVPVLSKSECTRQTMSSRELLGKAIEKQNNRPDRNVKIQRKRNCETHRKTEEPWAGKPRDQEQRKNKITKARLE